MNQRQALPRRYKARIGEIIMIAAEIDQLVGMALVRVTNIKIFDGLVLIDKMQISGKFNKLQYLVEAIGDTVVAEKMDAIHADLEKFLRGRNTFAHGVLCSRKEDDIIFSVTSDYVADASSDLYGNRISFYDYRELGKYIAIGERIIEALCSLFDVRLLNETDSVETREAKPPTPRSIRKGKGVKPKTKPR